MVSGDTLTGGIFTDSGSRPKTSSARKRKFCSLTPTTLLRAAITLTLR